MAYVKKRCAVVMSDRKKHFIFLEALTPLSEERYANNRNVDLVYYRICLTSSRQPQKCMEGNYTVEQKFGRAETIIFQKQAVKLRETLTHQTSNNNYVSLIIQIKIVQVKRNTFMPPQEKTKILKLHFFNSIYVFVFMHFIIDSNILSVITCQKSFTFLC